MSGSLGNEAMARAERERSVPELLQALRHSERVSQALREVGIALGTTFDLDDLLELILGKLTELVEADRATLYLLDEAHDELVSRMVVGEQVRSIRMKVGHGIAGLVAQTGRALRVRDAYSDARFERDWDVLTGYRTSSILAAPLKNHVGRTIGVIQILNKRDADEFTSDDEAILSALSTQAAVAIDNSRLFLSLIQKNKQLLDTKGELERRLRDLSLLFELERATGRATSLEELAQPLLSLSAKSTEARGAALLVAEEESGDLVQYVYDAEAPEKLTRIGVKAGEGILAAAMSRREMLQIRPGKRSAHWHERVEGSLPFSVDAALVLPLEGDDAAPLGAVGLFGTAGSRAFTGEDESLMQLVGANVSTAVRLFFASQARERGERLTSIGRLLSQVIHDFKTPMTVISGYVQLMTDAADTKQRHEYAEEVLKQFDVLTGMQREVLEFARGERTLFVRRVYLHKFFADLRRQLELELQLSGRPIELKLDIDTKVVARFDEARLARAVHNLARNAMEAMADGGVLTLHGKLEGKDLLIAVSDTGPGIPPAIEGRLFQSFVTMGKDGGTGLGLAIVKKIVEEHGGRVMVKSSPKGASFELRLPQPELAEAKSAPRKSSKGQRSTP
ncbi:MAG TPA: GAF domain-containing sensor histidine kinase [Polyangiaceae bacterium]|nr:GAF domain-containing sensor histidine kinase [Polyangiaceae bacterium]